MYEYVKRTYSVAPEQGMRVQHKMLRVNVIHD